MRKAPLAGKLKIPFPVGTSVHHPRAPPVARGALRARAPRANAQFRPLWGTARDPKVAQNASLLETLSGTLLGALRGQPYIVFLHFYMVLQCSG